MSRRLLGAREWLSAGLLLPCIFAACGTAVDAGEGNPQQDSGAATGGSDGGQLDAGSDAHYPPLDASFNDDASDDATVDVGADTSTLTPFAASPTAFFIHGALNLFPVRLCLEAGGTMLSKYPYPDDSPLPETNFPGVAPGGAVNVDDLLAVAALHDIATLHVIKADHILVASATPGSTMDCEGLVNTSALSSDHVITFDEVDLHELRTHTVRALVLGGCIPDDTLSDLVCGEGFNPTEGNLSIRTFGASPNLYAEPTTAYVVPMHVSPSLAAVQPESSLELTFGSLGSAATTVLSTNVPFETATPDPSPFTPPADLTRFADTGFSLSKVDATSNRTVLLEASLAYVQQVSSPFDTPDAFFTGANGFFFVLLGDVSNSNPWLVNGSWNPAYDGRGLHALALPFQFVMGDER